MYKTLGLGLSGSFLTHNPINPGVIVFTILTMTVLIWGGIKRQQKPLIIVIWALGGALFGPIIVPFYAIINPKEYRPLVKISADPKQRTKQNIIMPLIPVAVIVFSYFSIAMLGELMNLAVAFPAAGILIAGFALLLSLIGILTSGPTRVAIFYVSLYASMFAVMPSLLFWLLRFVLLFR